MTRCIFYLSLVVTWMLGASFSLGSEHRPLPSYFIDMRFLRDHSTLSGTAEQAEAYNKTFQHEPKTEFVQEANLDFGIRKVRVYLIASRHDNERDTQFMRDSLARLSINPREARLFIEAGDFYAANGGASQIIRLIKQKIPNLNYVIQRSQQNPTSFLNPSLYNSFPFTVVSREWTKQGGSFANFDLAYNFNQAAINFLLHNVSKVFALEFLRANLPPTTFEFKEFQTFIPSAFTASFTLTELRSFKDSAPDLPTWSKWLLGNNQVHDLVRERFMRYFLYLYAKDGDVVVTHPIHMKHLLLPEQRPLALDRRTF